ncbi:uncharacterized protein LOC112604076 [Melanaphis sacchari]|uniref:uncharacterized protein LOC112604076 n=1 Tax=Melanaphis sacchari TaxID=742174 RepID=UPI000DC14007|nr:uncharacterized protein LOC112604076 [Melanaphis sacchari]XP_025208731.1 uncharacterized protein LOC112604076 [Melanaphis sacchari]
MTETPCFFGLTTVRIGARIVAYLQFWSQLFVAVLLMLKYFYQWSDIDEGTTSAKTSSSDNQTPPSLPMKYYNELDFDNSIFSKLSYSILVMYASHYLKKATYTHNLMYLNFWMVLNSIYFLTSVAFIVFASLRIGKIGIFLIGLIGVLIESCELYVVYQFYTDEILSVAVNNDQNPSNNEDQSLPRSHTAVNIGTEIINTNDCQATLGVKNLTNNTY